MHRDHPHLIPPRHNIDFTSSRHYAGILNPMRPMPTLFALTLAAAFGGFAATAIRDGLEAPAQAQPGAATTLPATASLPTAANGVPVPSLAPMLQKVMPAVLSVHTKQRVRIRNPFADDPFFRRLFPNVPQERINESLGSGVIVDAARGMVLTNHHVIEGADEVSVTLADGRTLPATFVGSDPDSDVALMRISASNLTAVPLANSDQLRVGDFVVAVGNPFGLGQTVTSGIVSAVGRSGLPGLGFQNFIQTDASINPGNSGGALVNLRGELVGINTATFNPQGSRAGDIGLGFAIPSNLAANVMRQLQSTGEVRRGTLGVDTQTVDERIAKGLGLDIAQGAVVTRVYPQSAAAAAGLKVGDVIVGANGQRIDSRESLHNFEGLQAVGGNVSLELRRAGKPLTLGATLREQPRAIDGAQLDPRLSGASFAELPERLRQSGLDGVLVSAVARGSRAAQNGLQKDDVILAASSGEFDDLAGFRASFTQPPPQLLLRVLRGNTQGTLEIQ
jgi:serine protease DegQ